MGRNRASLKQWWRNKSISTNIIISFGILFAVVFSLSALIITLSVRRTMIQSVYDSNKKLVDETINNIDSLNDLISSLSFYVAGDFQLRQILKQFPEDPIEQITYKHIVKDYLTQLWMNRPEIVGISIYLDEMKEINTSTIGVSSIVFARQHGWIDTLGNNRGIIINTSNPVTRGNIVFNSLSLVKIFDETNTLLGLLSFEISARNVYAQCLEKALASTNSILFAMNEEHLIVNHSDMAFLGNPVHKFYPKLNVEKNDHSHVVNYDGGQYIQIISKPSSFNWRVVELIPLEDVFHFKPVIIFLSLLTSIAILIASLLIFLITKSLTKPIVDLSVAMVSEKPLQADLPLVSLENQNEIGTLYRSYQKMTSRITRLITQLQESMEQQKLLEINALRAQINPHFMYNCLDYINWKAQDAKAPEISKMLTNLSKFMRISLSDSNLTCPLAFEIEHMRTYLEIFQVRYEKSFTYEIHVETGLDDILIPQFILQPLVENSIMHGFDKHFSNGRIIVNIYKKDDWLHFEVIDNGKGMSTIDFNTVLVSPESSASERGLKNINDRIRFVVSPDSFTGLQKVESKIGLHIHFAIHLKGTQHG